MVDDVGHRQRRPSVEHHRHDHRELVDGALRPSHCHRGLAANLSVHFQVTESYGNKSQTSELKTTFSAFNTPYTSNPPVACATAPTQESWT